MPSETPPPLPDASADRSPADAAQPIAVPLTPGTKETSSTAWRRLHPLSPFVDAIGSAIRLVVPLVFVLAFTRRAPYELLFLVFLLPSTAFAFLRYSFYSYRLDADGIVVREGVLRRTVRQVPYARIQNLDLTSGLLQRSLRLTELSLETASGSEPEAVFRWLGPDQVEAIRARVAAARPKPAAAPATPKIGDAPPGGATPTTERTFPPAGAAPHVLYEVPLRDLVLLGAFSPRGLALFGAAFGFAWELGLYERPGLLRWIRDLFRQWSHGGGSDLAGTAMLIAAVVLLVSAVSVAMAMTEGFGFRLDDAGAELRTRAGLFTRRARTIPKARIQILDLAAPIHLRPFGRLQLWAGTAGGRSGDVAARSWILPIAPADQTRHLLATIQPEAQIPEDAWNPVHPGAARRLQRRGLFVVVGLAGILAARFGLPGLLALLAIPPVLFHARQSARRLGFAVTADVVAARHGFFVARTQIVRLGRIQAVRVGSSPFDRHWKMATVEVDTASPSRGQLRIPYLDEEVARRLHARLAQEASLRRFRW